MLIVETESSTYELDLLSFRLRRVGKEEPLGAVASSLRKDGEWIPFQFMRPLVEGQVAQFLLSIRDDGVKTVRTTTRVVAVSVEETEEKEKDNGQGND